jgi:co-chaperonin GroES (HSP10)
MKIKPVEETSAGGIIVSSQTELERERKGRDLGEIIEFGPIAFLGFATCEKPEDWGCKVGDTVEFNRYDGKISRASEIDKSLADYRLINDEDIIAVIEE